MKSNYSRRFVVVAKGGITLEVQNALFAGTSIWFDFVDPWEEDRPTGIYQCSAQVDEKTFGLVSNILAKLGEKFGEKMSASEACAFGFEDERPGERGVFDSYMAAKTAVVGR